MRREKHFRKRGRYRFALLCAALLATLLAAGCAGEYTVFAPADRAALRPGSIAVVSGLGDQLSVSFARQVTKDLQNQSRFRVITQHQITAKFSAYPANIIDDPGKFTESDRAKFARIARGLGADNLLVVWIYNAGSLTSGLLLSSLSFDVGGRLLSYPGGHETGRSSFGYNMGQAMRTQKETLHQMIANVSQILVKKLVSSTGMAKTG